MNAPILSVVTLAFNQRQFLHRALASVPNDPRIEHIVVDPGSSDGTRDYLNTCWKSSKTLVLKSDSGPAEGLNNGFEAAQGEFGYFINGDDFLLPGAIDCFFNFLALRQDFNIILGGGYVLDLRRQRARELIMPAFSVYCYAAGAYPFFQQGMFFKISDFRKVGGFNIHNKTCWDAELLVDMVLHGAKVQHLRHSIAVFVLHETSISGSGRLQDLYYLDSMQIVQKFKVLKGFRMLNFLRRYAVLLRRLYAWRWAIADLRDRMVPSYNYRKIRAVYDSLAEPNL